MPTSPLAADPYFVDRSYAPNAPTSEFLFYFVSLFLFPIDHGNPYDSQSGSPVAFFMTMSHWACFFVFFCWFSLRAASYDHLRLYFTQLVS